MISASSLERVMACPSSAVLPSVHSTSEHAERGTAIHAFIQAVVSGTPKTDALRGVPEEWAHTCANLDFATLLGGLREVRAEVAYAVDFADLRARELGQDIGRSYERFGLGPSEIPGTLDVEGTDGLPVVIDVKAGWEPVTTCCDNQQVGFAALARHLLTGAPEVKGRIAYVREDGRVENDPHTFTMFDFEDFMLRGRAVLASVERLKVEAAAYDVSEGPHCRYCPAVPYCPAHTRLARAMVDDLTAIDGQLAALTPEQAGIAWMKAKQIEKLLDRVVGGLRTYADREPLPLPNGKVLRPVKIMRRYIDGKRALTLLHEMGATQDEIESCNRQAETVQLRQTKGPRGEGP